MSRINSGVMSSENMDWATPWDFYHELDEIFHFGFDAAANGRNTKSGNYLSLNDDALERNVNHDPVSWVHKLTLKYGLIFDASNNVAFLNPPYGVSIKHFAKMASEQAQCFQTITVMLCPHRTDPQWFQDNVSYNQFARFKIELHDRVRFKRPGTSSERSAPAFPSALVIYTPEMFLRTSDNAGLLDRFPNFGNLNKIGFVIDLQLQRERMAGYGRKHSATGNGIVNIAGDGKNSIYISEEDFEKLKARPGVNIEPNLIVGK